jgi:excisionase family DNA binding protein
MGTGTSVKKERRRLAPRGDVLLTIEASRQVLRLSRPTLEKIIDRGELSVVRVAPRSLRIRESALLDYIERHTERRPAPAREGVATDGNA